MTISRPGQAAQELAAARVGEQGGAQLGVPGADPAGIVAPTEGVIGIGEHVDRVSQQVGAGVAAT